MSVYFLCLNQASAGRRRPRRHGFPNSSPFLLTNHEIRGRKLGRKGGLQRTGRRASKIQNCKDVDVGCPRERFLAISSVSTNVHG